ncbi:MAG: ABC transporter ATP-binding protein [Methanomicrobiales archaeon]|jgi:peptide/nickel transport system ATP-binding protein|nr:ABC transporter ATP-binding protein [Methanomicrobiales archaeon]
MAGNEKKQQDNGPISHMLEVENLSVTFKGKNGDIPALRGIDLHLGHNECLAIVGESGCGKSVIAQAIMRLLPEEAVLSGRVRYNTRDLFSETNDTMNHIRGKEIAMVFQSPERALNPVYKIGRQLVEPMVMHGICSRSDAHIRAKKMLTELGFKDVDELMHFYPWMCSGGMCQRILFSAACLLQPKIIIADEPTKGLDADRISDIEHMLNMASTEYTGVLLITHDLKLAQRVAHRIMIMYAGVIVESGDVSQVFSNPLHPYTQGLIRSMPEHGFHPISGMSPALSDLPSGCVFHPRCKHAAQDCQSEIPKWKERKEVDGNAHSHMVRCLC